MPFGEGLLDIVCGEEMDYAAVQEAIRTLCGKYPFLHVDSIGKSVCGRALTLLTLGDAPETVLYAAAFHGIERITTRLLLCFAANLCAALASDTCIAQHSVRRAFYGRTLALLPLVNPDGCEIALHGASAAMQLAPQVEEWSAGNTGCWNANARGVDINHNFDAGFAALTQLEIAAGTHAPGHGKYNGGAPESEPESKVLADYCRATPIRQLFAFHSQGKEIYHTYDNYEPPRAHRLGKLLAASSGYTLSRPSGTASHGGCKDWFIKRFRRPSFTVEVGEGKNPLPPRDIEQIYNELEEMLMLGILL